LTKKTQINTASLNQQQIQHIPQIQLQLQQQQQPLQSIRARHLYSPPAIANTSHDSAVLGSTGNAKQYISGSHAHFVAKQFDSGDAKTTAEIKSFPKLDNILRGAWTERKIGDYNIVANLDHPIQDIDELRDGTKVRLESSQFTPLDQKWVPSVDELTSRLPLENGYFHHNELLRQRPQYMTTTPKIKQQDNIDVWMNEFRDYVWQPVIQSYQTLPSRARIRLLDENGMAHGRGGRKSSKAFASVKPGSGKIFVNGAPYTDYFTSWEQRSQVIMPFYSTGTISQFDVFLKVQGGGYTGQSEAAKLAIANALQNFEPQFRPTLKVNNLLKRDPRAVERKHVGHKKARKSFTWVKR
jgi:small subunit ribosomal protein S9